jgi:hypothetical protein
MSKLGTSRIGVLCLAGSGLLLTASSNLAQTATQTFNLRAGWNAIWLELEPTSNGTGSVLTNLPLSSIWTYLPNANRVHFIRDQTEASFNDPAWLRYFPAGRPEAFANNLFAMHAGSAYLVKVTAAATLNITGQPVLKTVAWQPDSYNLRGFPIDPDHAPGFNAFFAPSPAHAGQAIYRLGADGKWAPVDAVAVMGWGEAYWVYCKGGSTFQAPLAVTLPIGTSLEYGVQLDSLGPQLLNLGSSGKSVSIRDVNSGASSPLSFRQIANGQYSWVNLPDPYAVALGPSGSTNASINISLAVRRRDIPDQNPNYASVLEIKDNVGSRYRIGITASKLLAARSSQAQPLPQSLLAGGPSALKTGRGGPYTKATMDTVTPGSKVAGLWVGTAEIDHVNQPASGSDPSTPQPTRTAFPLRLLLHVTDTGETRFLKEVTQMVQPSVRDTNHVVTQPARYVLLTDPSQIPNFTGAALRNGQGVGVRLSSVDFDFAAGSSNYLVMNGGFGIGQTASCTIVVSNNLPTNPFLHRYHPDHDNLDVDFATPLPLGHEEVYTVTRAVTLTFAANDPAGTNALSNLAYGDTVIGGTYHESIAGLHTASFEVEGTFRLTRVNNSPVLNQ